MGFDFGILVAETKAPEGEPAEGPAQKKILANTIAVRTNAVTLLKSDRVLIADNQLTYAAERGRGVVVEFDGDENRIVNNALTSTDAASTGLRANTISGRMERGISFAGTSVVYTDTFILGTCTLDVSRHCMDNSDCNLQGSDQTNKGPCAGTSSLTYNGNSVRLVAEGNSLAGTFNTAALFANNMSDFAFRGNLVEGGGATASGIQLQGPALNGVVQRNVVSGVGNALLLRRPSALSWMIGLNDFTDYLTAVRTPNDYNLPTELGGNYWGLPCPGFEPRPGAL